ncbi:MAG: phosphate ABC transporter ATP-binding protein PstB, partial [Kiritimatiellales bacterium]
RKVKISVQNLNVFFGRHQALRNLTLNVAANRILGIIGPASSGKTSFLRALNRMNDLDPESRAEGRVLLDGTDIYHPSQSAVQLRKRVGMVFALPMPLPMSIYDNVVYGPRLSGVRDRATLDEIVERTLTSAFLWDEVKDRLNLLALRLSGGQQQRLCLARTLAMDPEVVLLDEPCSGLDPISTARIEDALSVLKARYTIILVTNNTKQASRVADETAFFLMGELVEMGETSQIFTVPKDQRTSDYVTGRFG